MLIGVNGQPNEDIQQESPLAGREFTNLPIWLSDHACGFACRYTNSGKDFTGSTNFTFQNINPVTALEVKPTFSCLLD